MQKEARDKRRSYSEQKDKHLKNQSNDLTLNEHSTTDDYLREYAKLTTLSVAEVDYQLRAFLLTPTNKLYLINMITAVLQAGDQTQNQ